MSSPQIQRFFETPLVEVLLQDLDEGYVAKRVVELAKRYTVDVSRPAAARFRWQCSTDEIVLAGGARTDWQLAPGAFWTAFVCVDPCESGAELQIEDPRAAMMAPGPAALSVSEAPFIESISAQSGRLAMFPGYLRHRLVNDSNEAATWIAVSLTAIPSRT